MLVLVVVGVYWWLDFRIHVVVGFEILNVDLRLLEGNN
jgi:hypothetical protein